MAFFLLGLLSLIVNTPASFVTSSVVYLPVDAGVASTETSDPANSSTSAIYCCFASSYIVE